MIREAYLGSRFNIPDTRSGSGIQVSKKHLTPDTGSGSATLQTIIIGSVSVSANEAEGGEREVKGENGSCPYAFPVLLAYHDVKPNQQNFYDG